MGEGRNLQNECGTKKVKGRQTRSAGADQSCTQGERGQGEVSKETNASGVRRTQRGQ